MRQYELAIRIAQVHHLVDERKYKKALAVIQTLDMRQIKTLSDLKVFAEVFTRTEQFDAAKATYLRIYRKSRTRRVLHRLIYLSIRTNAIEDAEAYYDEYVRMHPSERDALILRYRIDKTKGVPIGELIHTLQDLKQEEYIEEWAYELAKLYHRAGRREECMRECEDIILWFGSGEIVERAKVLIDHLEERDPMPYIDDKDFTVPKKETPNPEDTGSLPDLKEFVKEQKEQKKAERRREREMRNEDDEDEFEDDYDDDYEKEEEDDRDIQQAVAEMESSVEKEAVASMDSGEDESPKKKKRREVVVKDPDEMEDETDGFDDDYDDDDMFSNAEKGRGKKGKGGIHKLSSSILKFVMKDDDDIFDDLEEEEPEIPVAKTTDNKKPEVHRDASKKLQTEQETTTEIKSEKNVKGTETKAAPLPVHSQSGTGITQDLAKEIAAICEMEHKEQLKEKAVTVINDGPNLATNVLERMTKAAKMSTQKTYIPLDVEEIVQSEQPDAEEKMPVTEGTEEKEIAEEKSSTLKDTKEVVDTTKDKIQEVPDISDEKTSEAVVQNAIEEPEKTVETVAQNMVEEPEKVVEAVTQNVVEEPEKTVETVAQNMVEEPEKVVEAATQNVVEELEKAVEAVTQNVMESSEKIAKEEDVKIYHSPLEGYSAPESKVIENEFVGIPEIDIDDLPTTRALQRSFRDVLTLISGELDPSHFVLMGDGAERIVGVAKQIVRVMKETGYLSVGRIAKISSEQLNKMDLINFREQLKGNCLLIDGAADLLFPTISKMFSIMEEYHGDFVVILADEGATLDQLFRFVPVLAKKFKYIIDISQYTKEDYDI